MPAKQILFRQEAHAKLLAGINPLAQAVRVTLGPKARTVVLERAYGAPTIINPGAVVRVGAATETEMKEKKSRVEDAMHATHAAVEEGVLPGGGVALIRARSRLGALHGENADQDAGIKIVLRAVEEPLRQIVANAGADPSVVLSRIAEGAGNFGFNALTNQFGDLVAMGVLDPCKVTRTALQNAASIAGLALTTECMIARVPEEKSGKPRRELEDM